MNQPGIGAQIQIRQKAVLRSGVKFLQFLSRQGSERGKKLIVLVEVNLKPYAGGNAVLDLLMVATVTRT